MYTPDYQSLFKKERKKYVASGMKVIKGIDEGIEALLESDEKPLDPKFKDKPSQPPYATYRHINVAPDVRILYNIKGMTLTLYRVNSHANLFE